MNLRIITHLSPEVLGQWHDETSDLPFMMPDYHRLQVEHFIWQEVRGLEGQPWKRVLEVGAEQRRPYLTHLGENYVTMNVEDPAEVDWVNQTPPGICSPDVFGDIMAMPFPDEDFHFFIATETMEHVEDPWRAIREVYRVLRPGGVALFTTPFMWPYHGSQRYADFWRFTADGWRLLCKEFKSVRVFPTECNPVAPWQEVADQENMGKPDEVRIATGYLVKAVK